VGLFITHLATNPWDYFMWIIIVMFSICVHEYAHAAVALRFGDDTAAQQGHLSLNPMIQMGPTSLVILCLIGIAWGAVPVDISRIRRRLGEALVALAGPLSNLGLCILFAAGVVIAELTLGHGEQANRAVMFFQLGAAANAVLFLFNLLPIPMLDGWAAISVYVRKMQHMDQQQLSTISWFMILFIFVTPILDVIWGLGYRMAGLISFWWIKLFSLFMN